MSILKIGVSDETRRAAVIEALRAALASNDADALSAAKALACAYSTKRFGAVLADINKLPTLKQLVAQGYAHA